MTNEQIREAIAAGHTCLGMEFGSTRIKAVLIDDDHRVLASGAVTWENRFENGIWTYDLADAVANMQMCFAALRQEVEKLYGMALARVGMIGISGMMHGLLALDAGGELVTPFRTWRNTMTEPQAEFLTELFGMTIPQRWSIVHLLQLMQTEPACAARIDRITTLSGYIHYLLTGVHALGCCEAAGMLPAGGDPTSPDYLPDMVASFDTLASEAGMPWRLRDIFPCVLRAGACAGYLTEEGARLLDPTGTLSPGIPFCPAEGDGGTGMVCTGSLAPGMAAVSAGTSTFGLFVLDRAPEHLDRHLELTVTPDGDPVIEIQSTNGTAELDGWASVIGDALGRLGVKTDAGALYEMLLSAAMDGHVGDGGIAAFNCLSGEHLLGLSAGRPLYVRRPDCTLQLSDFMRAQLFSVFAPLAYGFSLMDACDAEKIVSVRAHGGLFRTRGAAQPVLAAALGRPVTVSEGAGEGGPYGAALLAAYAKNRGADETLAAYLQAHAPADAGESTVLPDPALCAEYRAYLQTYLRASDIERAATVSI